MNKLIELLNEYEKLNMGRWFVYYCERDDTIENTNEFIKVSEVISKRYGFIKWLVENDKIELKAGPLYGFQPIMNNRQPFTLYETLLMLLAISDSPIDDLVSILR